MNKFERARLKYKPEIIKYLLIAEAPPKSESNRFFYFENVPTQDSLFLETMKVLYPMECWEMNTREIRMKKAQFLMNFKNDGFYLIDSLDTPFEHRFSQSAKVKHIENGQAVLLSKINSIIDRLTKVILISAPVFKANFSFLKRNKINVINRDLIEFPGSGGQAKFRKKMMIIFPGKEVN